MNTGSLLAAALLAVACAAPVLADDGRIATRAFVPDQVIAIPGQVGVQTTIAFGDDESIENVAVGDSALWQITPNKRANFLFVKPLAKLARTNMTVITSKRSYFFDLRAGTTGAPLYFLRFKHPDAAPQTATPATRLAEIAPPAVDVVLNYSWKPRGNADLLPSKVYDDGESMFLSWPSGKPIPAMLVRNEKGEEGPVNFAVQDDVLVIDGVPRVLILRSGKNSAFLEYAGINKVTTASR